MSPETLCTACMIASMLVTVVSVSLVRRRLARIERLLLTLTASHAVPVLGGLAARLDELRGIRFGAPMIKVADRSQHDRHEGDMGPSGPKTERHPVLRDRVRKE